MRLLRQPGPELIDMRKHSSAAHRTLPPLCWLAGTTVWSIATLHLGVGAPTSELASIEADELTQCETSGGHHLKSFDSQAGRCKYNSLLANKAAHRSLSTSRMQKKPKLI